jgi:archaellum biogenesis protein FlaJ (TadC family)
MAKTVKSWAMAMYFMMMYDWLSLLLFGVGRSRFEQMIIEGDHHFHGFVQSLCPE